MSQDTLYLKINQNVQVEKNKVYIKDFAQVFCRNHFIENHVNVLCWQEAVGKKPGRYVHSVLEVIACIQKEFPDLEISNIGETDFILTYEKRKKTYAVLSWIKIIAVCILSFFGAAFSIMTFNNDVSVTELFSDVYQLFTGTVSNGFTILEISYSLGLGIGILVFFNHFTGKTATTDPSPMEIQMHTYEEDVNATVIEKGKERSL